jgi:hypothetical protein
MVYPWLIPKVGETFQGGRNMAMPSVSLAVSLAQRRIHYPQNEGAQAFLPCVDEHHLDALSAPRAIPVQINLGVWTHEAGLSHR